MKTIETYFGLEFGDEFPLHKETRRKLAKLLYANPNTYPEEAIRILHNLNLWLTFDQLIESLQAEVKKAAQINLDDFKESNIRKLFFDKFFFWVKAFSCPTPEEITEIAKIFTKIPEIIFLNEIERAVLDFKMPFPKICDYLKKYSSLMTHQQINVFLDIYNKKVKIDSLNTFQNNIQLKIQLL